MRKTLFVDLDGTLIEHVGSYTKINYPKLLPGVREQLDNWVAKDYVIIIATGRKESFRPQTIKLLKELNIPYDQLVMSLGRGPRIILNDNKPGLPEDMAIAIPLERNKGLEDLDI